MFNVVSNTIMMNGICSWGGWGGSEDDNHGGGLAAWGVGGENFG